MKKFLLTLLLTIFIATPAFADKRVFDDYIKISGERMIDYSLTSGSSVSSSAIDVSRNVGFTTLVVTEDIAGGAGDVDIYVEYSLDKVTWTRAYTSDMAGTLTLEGNIVTALQNATRWMVYTPRMSPFMRVVFDPDANSTITAEIIYQQER